MVVLITGVAGFIGANLAESILKENQNTRVVGIDCITDYYDVGLKESRLKKLNEYEGFQFIKGNIADKTLVEKIFRENQPEVVVNLAAQAGVRYSIDNPDSYIESNIIGFYNILEACRHSYDQKEYADYQGVKHLVYASSSSVYGANKKVPYSTEDKVDLPVSLYAATKKSDELMAHAYSKLYGIPATGLRFFTVYGPAGRPDMAYFKFTNKIIKGEPIQIYNNGDMKRDFTYIDDIIAGIRKVMDKIPEENELGVRYKIYNIGNNQPEDLLYFVETLEECLRKYGVIPENYKVQKEFLPMQPGDVYQTYADTSELEHDFDYKPSTSLKDGLDRFAAWYRDYYMEANA